MRNKEVFIGAWVETDFGQQIVAQIPNDATVRTGDGRLFCIEDLKPVPITAEILEKNFERRGESFPVWAIYDEFFELRIYQQNDGLWQVSYDNIEANFPTCRNLICFVHELQMALTLNGIYKEIML